MACPSPGRDAEALRLPRADRAAPPGPSVALSRDFRHTWHSRGPDVGGTEAVGRPGLIAWRRYGHSVALTDSRQTWPPPGRDAEAAEALRSPRADRLAPPRPLRLLVRDFRHARHSPGPRRRARRARARACTSGERQAATPVGRRLGTETSRRVGSCRTAIADTPHPRSVMTQRRSCPAARAGYEPFELSPISKAMARSQNRPEISPKSALRGLISRCARCQKFITRSRP
jgi:hypothetical protein